MILEKIYERLDLFPEYLKYRLDNWVSLPFGKMHTFRTTGMLFLSEIKSFDQWLYDNGRDDLVLPQREFYACVDPYEAGNFVYNEDKMVIWEKDPKGKFKMVVWK